jgi:hypothetical protein
MAASLAACGGSSSSPSGTTSSAPVAPASSAATSTAPTTPTSAPATSAPAAPAGDGVSDPAAATKAIKKLYPKFFASKVPQAKKLLEDGSTLSAAFVAAEKLAGTTVETAKVDTVSITGPTTANLTFDLLGNGKPLLKGSDGMAVEVNGKWLVAKQTFCTLVLLGGSKVKGCS